jgi:hypothetical protein
MYAYILAQIKNWITFYILFADSNFCFSVLLLLYVHMYLCTYIFMYIYIYVHIYLCTYVSMYMWDCIVYISFILNNIRVKRYIMPTNRVTILGEFSPFG